MNKNSILHIRGLKSPIAITKSEATTIQSAWDNKDVSDDTVLKVGTINFQKRDIKIIEVNSDTDKKEVWDNFMRDFYDDEKRNRDILVKKSSEYKAGLLDMFFFLYKIAMDEEPTQEIIDKAKKIQLDFFNQNPHRTLCDLYLLKTLIPGLNDNSSPSKLWTHFRIHLKDAYFRIVEKAVFRDMQLSGQLKSNFAIKPLKEITDDMTFQEMRWNAEDNRREDDDFNKFVSNTVNDF